MPFRVIAIAADESRVEHIFEIAASSARCGFALMLRDPEHGRERVEELAAFSLKHTLPANLTLISNSFPIDGIEFVHCTSSQLRDGLAGLEQSRELGYSTHSLEEIRRAEGHGARYVTLSPIFPSPSKPGDPGLGIERLRQIASRTSLPLFALGGIDRVTALQSIAAGAYGIASISLFDPACDLDLQGFLEELAGYDSPG